MINLPSQILTFSKLATQAPTKFDLVPDADERATLAETLMIDGLRKARFTGTIAPAGSTDWQLSAKLGATVVQPCVATLDPVTTRIDEVIARRFVKDLPEPDAPETEMPEDETAESLPQSIDLYEVMVEALALALPAFPRAEGASLGQVLASEPGVNPMTDDDMKPFAGLASLRDALEKKASGDGE